MESLNLFAFLFDNILGEDDSIPDLEEYLQGHFCNISDGDDGGVLCDIAHDYMERLCNAK